MLAGRLAGLHCSVGDACSRWCDMCGSWYFPKFLFNGGSCTHMNIASLMVLGWAVDFLVYYAELVGVHGMACGGAVLMYGGGGLKMFFDSVT